MKNEAVNKKQSGGSIKLNNRITTFFICVLVSISFWLIVTLSKEYSVKFSYNVIYSALPAGNILSNELPDKVELQIRASGFQIVWNKIKRKNKAIFIDLSNAIPLAQQNRCFLLTNSRIDKINAQFSSAVNVQKISPDTIYLNFNKKVTKEVPVKSNIHVNLNPQFQLIDSISITPEKVKISGASDIVEKISFVETDVIELNDVSKSTDLNLKLKSLRDNNKIEIFPNEINARITVGKYTEATAVVPIHVLNLPAGYSLKTFPEEVTIKYNVTFRDYEKIRVGDFKVAVDFKSAQPTVSKLKVQLINFPDKARGIKIDPEKVEYIIRK